MIILDHWFPKVNVAIESGATTLSPTDGKYANLYDNIFYDSKVNVTDSDIFLHFLKNSE